MSAEEAGPSGSGTPQAPALLAEANAKFEQGIQAIKENDMEKAVGLFASVLEVRTKHYGDLAPECASAYYRYGAALLYQAQDNADVFAGGVGGSEEPEEDKENDDSRPPSSAAASSAAPAAVAAAAGDYKGKGKAPAVEAVDEEEEEQEQEEDENEGSAAAAEQAESDLQLAWENLETAKVIWQRSADDHVRELADVHMLLSDVAMESDDFETALAEVEAGLGYLQKTVADDDRRLAEAEYKRCMALQFSNRPQEALAAAQAAVACLQKRQAGIEQRQQALEEGQEEEEARLGGELADVKAVLEDLQDKVSELQELVSEDADTRKMLKGFLGNLGSAMAGGGGGGGPPTERPPQQQQQAPRGPTEQAGFDKAKGTAVPDAAGAGGVRNLGVVGRGTKRIKLQPLPVGGPAAVGSAGDTGAAPDSAAAAAAASDEPKGKKMRSLEDLMGGGSGGDITMGFDAPAAAAPAAPAPAAGQATKPAAPALPAFLQAASVQAIYSPASGAAAGATGEQPHGGATDKGTD